jgi:hypothetical protein
VDESARYNDKRTGRFVPGNPGKRPGTKHGLKSKTAKLRRQTQEIQRTGSEKAVEAGAQHVVEIMESLAAEAKNGNVAAARIVLQHAAPPAPLSVVRSARHLGDLPPDARLAEISRMVAGGEMAVEHGQALAALARAELETSVLAPLRAAVRALKEGEGTDRVLQRLMLALDGLPQLAEPDGQSQTVIEGTATVDTADQ